jgi:ABC-type branched-subunit amino acid transport system permease subunit
VAESTAPPVPGAPEPVPPPAPPLPAATRRQLGRGPTTRYAVVIVALAIAILFPWIRDALPNSDYWLPMTTVLITADFVLLALGLNIVVGYAGLLDLGYVAVWAIGAYVMGWLASGFFVERSVHILTPIPDTIPGIHINFWIVAIIGGCACALAGIVIGAPTLRLRDGKLGRAWIAIREDELAAGAMGIPLMRTKLWAYAVGAFFGGVGGVFYAADQSAVFPTSFFFNISILILCMVILGGMGNVWGVILGASILAWLNYKGLAVIGTAFNSAAGTDINVPNKSFLIFGIILVTMMLLRPEGLLPAARQKALIHEEIDESTGTSV